jgi:hypothetical protein
MFLLGRVFYIIVELFSATIFDLFSRLCLYFFVQFCRDETDWLVSKSCLKIVHDCWHKKWKKYILKIITYLLWLT